MSTFRLYLQLGIEHITDLQGYDHILFLVALCAVYQIKHWKKILILITAIFGLIHGLGFSNYLRSLLSSENKLTGPLFSFNLGIESGQLLVVSGFLVLGIIFMNVFKAKPREWNLVFSGAGLGVSTVLMIERFPL